MKKILAVLATITLTLTACADRQHLIEYSELPVQAQAFIQKYFNVSDVAVIQVEDFGRSREYDIRLKNGTEIDFDYQGNLKSINCEISPVPEGIVPELIVSYVQLHYPNHFIVEYTINYRRLEVELSNGIDLLFDLEGHFIGVD